jgi:hypothetical protein
MDNVKLPGAYPSSYSSGIFDGAGDDMDNTNFEVGNHAGEGAAAQENPMILPPPANQHAALPQGDDFLDPNFIDPALFEELANGQAEGDQGLVNDQTMDGAENDMDLPQGDLPSPSMFLPEDSPEVANPEPPQPLLARPPMEELLRQKDHVYTGLIANIDDWRRAATDYIAFNDKKGKAAGQTAEDFPEDDESRRALVRELFEAIVDFSDVADGPKPAASRARRASAAGHEDQREDPQPLGDGPNLENGEEEADEGEDGEDHEPQPAPAAQGQARKEPPHITRVKALSNFEVELIAFDLLLHIYRAQNGVISIANWMPARLVGRYEKCRNFRERFDIVKEGVRRYKLIVSSLMDTPYINRLAMCPRRETRVKASNKISNAQKTERVKLANEMLSKGLAKTTDTGSLELSNAVDLSAANRAPDFEDEEEEGGTGRRRPDPPPRNAPVRAASTKGTKRKRSQG